MSAVGALYNLTAVKPEAIPVTRQVIADILRWPSSEAGDRVKIMVLDGRGKQVYRDLRNYIVPLTYEANGNLANAARASLERLEK
jgi:hypothetical protein